jgi:hypothetical protein
MVVGCDKQLVSGTHRFIATTGIHFIVPIIMGIAVNEGQLFNTFGSIPISAIPGKISKKSLSHD